MLNKQWGQVLFLHWDSNGRHDDRTFSSSFFFFFPSLFLGAVFYWPTGACKYSEIVFLFKKKSAKSLTQNSLFWKFVAGLSRRVGLRREGCRGTVCQLLLAGGLDLLVLGKRYAADLEYIVCAVQGAFPRVLTGSWDDSIRRHWTSLDLWGSWRSCFGGPPLFWVPSARVAL